MAQFGFYYDQTNCVGCRGCQIACKDAKNLDVGYLLRKVTEYDGGTFPDVWASALSMSCNHCATPACQAACASGAISKRADNGLVSIDAELCIGCGLCVTACPYTHPVMIPEQGVAVKCDGCMNDFLVLNERPTCVDACITRCLKFGDIEELKSQYGDNLVSDLSVLPDSTMTTPSLLINPKEQML